MNLKFSVLLVFLLAFGACQLTENKTPISFNKDIRPILNEKCLSCHGGVKQMGNFSLLFESDAFGETESGLPAIVKGNHQKSELYKRLVNKDVELRMPYEAPSLSQKEIAIIAQWIDEGAKWEKHWAYVPPKKNTKPPQTKNVAWAKNGIDQFVLKNLEDQGLSPNPIAEKSRLIRRLSLDLIGLPPTLPTPQNKLAKKEEKDIEQVIDDLLSSPHFGERWASIWLDLARYGDSQGYQKDNIRRHIWRYRDWVIHAFNEDLPFDQFTIQQLAGDLLPNPTENQLLATAFHRNTNTNSEGGTDDEEFRTYAVMDRLNTTFEIWQGMTLSCVQCHSHPYDPIRHEEYYKGLAYFNNTQDTDRNDEFPRKKLLSPGEKILIGQLKKQIIQEKNRGDTLSDAYVELISQMEAIQPAPVPVMADLPADSSRPSHIFERGNWLVKGAEVSPAVPQTLMLQNSAFSLDRLGLAKWMIHPDNPLTSRVIVNRFWEAIFGIGLVETLEDFGTQGAKPSNQALLDWLAVRFVQHHKWSVKGLLKDIVLSATYQQSTETTPEKLELDPDNQLFTRGPRFRLSAEQIRDQALAVSGLLNRKVYGPSVMPYLPDGVYSVIRHAHRWKTSKDGDSYRRGLYTFWRKTSPYPSMITFDKPSREFCVSRRVRTNTPLQAMVTLNDPVYLEAATALAKLMIVNSNTTKQATDFDLLSAQISHGFECVLFRKPTVAQLKVLKDFYYRTLTEYEQKTYTYQDLVGEEEISPKEFAAMINVANVLMNLDEFLMKG